MRLKFNKIDSKFKKAFMLIIGTGTAITVGRLSLHTFWCDNYIENIWVRYKYGSPLKKLHSNLMHLTTQVLDDLDLRSKLHKFEFFPCSGQEPKYLGLYHLRKAYIGLPFYFEYLSEKGVDINELVFFNDQSPNWKRKEGKQFIENLILSEKAKKYAIAENIVLSKSYELYIRSLSPLGAGFFSAFSCIRMHVFLDEKYSKLTAKSKFSISFFFSILIFLMWCLLLKRLADEHSREVIEKFLESIKDKQDYIDGGIEYYTKFQKRNLLFRGFMGENGKNYIKPNGDVVRYLSKKYSISQMIEAISKHDKFFDDNTPTK